MTRSLSRKTSIKNSTLASLIFLIWCSLLPLRSISAINPAINLPDLGASDLKSYGDQTEQALGRSFQTALYTQHTLLEDPEILSFIRRMGHKIATQTGDNRSFKFEVIINDEINAFAGPNGIIGIHTGLIEAAQTEDELAAVIAHEIAHVTQKHLSRRFEQYETLNLTNIGTLLAAILIGSQDPSAGMAVYLGGLGLSTQEALKFSRIHEHEADHIGIQYLHQSHYDPLAMSHFFGRIADKAQYNEFKPPEILLTHPVTEKRLSQAQSRAAMLPKLISRPKDQLDFKLIQLRLSVLLNKPLNHPALTKLSKTEQCYLSVLKADKMLPAPTPNAPKLCKSFNPNNRLLALRNIQNSRHLSVSEQQKAFEQLRAFYPKDFAILWHQADHLQQHHQMTRAVELLENEVKKYKSKYLLYQKLAELYALDEQTNKLNFTLAQANIEIGNIEKARYLLKQIPLNSPIELAQKAKRLLSSLPSKETK